MGLARRSPTPSVPAETGCCRRCPVTCDLVVYPAACVEADCPRLTVSLYGGRPVMGCAVGIFRGSIDIELFECCQRTRHGFGALRAEREPLPICRSAIDQAFPHRIDADACINPAFLLDDLRRTVAALDRETVRRRSS